MLFVVAVIDVDADAITTGIETCVVVLFSLTWCLMFGDDGVDGDIIIGCWLLKDNDDDDNVEWDFKFEFELLLANDFKW